MKLKFTKLARRHLQPLLKPGDLAVDATAGNGKDTVFLARQVGPRGRVFAFDIQPEALASTAERLQSENLMERVEMICVGHEHIDSHVKHPVSAVMFNLGYLPGGDHHITTRPLTTVTAVGKALELLKPGGAVSLVIYPGHQGGEEEKLVLLDYCAALSPWNFHVVHSVAVNVGNNPPELLMVYKQIYRGKDSSQQAKQTADPR